MNVIFGIVLQAAGAFILTASAQSPAAPGIHALWIVAGV
jgi:hypothetical protein